MGPRGLLDAQSAGLLLGFRRIAELGAGKRRRGGRPVGGGLRRGGWSRGRRRLEGLRMEASGGW
jgi:hypothetical protein